MSITTIETVHQTLKVNIINHAESLGRAFPHTHFNFSCKQIITTMTELPKTTKVSREEPTVR